MAMICVRTVGMSYSIEGVGGPGSIVEKLERDLKAIHGIAVASFGSPAEAVLIDRKAVRWEALLEWLEGWIRHAGGTTISCQEERVSQGALARISFELN
jgi:hypothetical protein